jgi:predicted MFS family arabinose efflux permease
LQADAKLISTMLMVYGIGGVCGTYFSSRMVDKLGAHFMVNLAVMLMTLAMVTWSFGSTNVIVTGALILVWGLGSFAVNGAQQFRLIAAAPALATASLPLNSSASFAGQAVAALIGGAIVSNMSPTVLPIAGAAFLGTALIVSSVLMLQRPDVQPFEVAGSQTKAVK